MYACVGVRVYLCVYLFVCTWWAGSLFFLNITASAGGAFVAGGGGGEFLGFRKQTTAIMQHAKHAAQAMTIPECIRTVEYEPTQV